MKERAATILPYAIAAVLPLAGLVLAGLWATQKRTYDAALLLAAALLGAIIWVTVLSA
ncbi:MAG: hypothetical protein JWO90_1957 [Solirubrobacterales bacterium]|jgi:hypothetical protein|nr:hypothetical protein [Solirubrobacterales bacterium]